MREVAHEIMHVADHSDVAFVFGTEMKTTTINPTGAAQKIMMVESYIRSLATLLIF